MSALLNFEVGDQRNHHEIERFLTTTVSGLRSTTIMVAGILRPRGRARDDDLAASKQTGVNRKRARAENNSGRRRPPQRWMPILCQTKVLSSLFALPVETKVDVEPHGTPPSVVNGFKSREFRTFWPATR